MTIYNPIEFWRKEGETYKNEFLHIREGCIPEVKLQESMLLEYLKTLKFKTVLELGMGFGRITELVLDNFNVDNYVGMDISRHQLDHIKRKDVDRILANVHDLPLSNTRFDLILSVELFLHIKPEMMVTFLGSLMPYSDNIINIDPDPDPRMHYVPDYYNFLHDFEHLYKELGFKVNIIKLKKEKVNTRQFIFHASK